jgi:hypothetical protein
MLLVEMSCGRGLAGMFLNDMLALGERPTHNVRVLGFASGQDLIRVTACTAPS